MSDLIDNITQRIQQLEDEKAHRTEQFQLVRAQYESDIAVIDAKMNKVWALFEFLDDPLGNETIRELVVGVAVQSGVTVPQVPKQDDSDRHPGLNGVTLFLREIDEGAEFTVDDIFELSIRDRPSTERLRHPDWINKRKGFISVALGSLRKKGMVEMTGKAGAKIVYRKTQPTAQNFVAA